MDISFLGLVLFFRSLKLLGLLNARYAMREDRADQHFPA
jgi:hypothetical protein